jgi:hypothetical protein
MHVQALLALVMVGAITHPVVMVMIAVVMIMVPTVMVVAMMNMAGFIVRMYMNERA